MPKFVTNAVTGEVTEEEITELDWVPPDPLMLLNELLNGIDAATNERVVASGILVPQLFYASKIADNALLVQQWYADGQPEIDPTLMDDWEAYTAGNHEAINLSDLIIAKYCTAIAEAAAYRATSKPEMTPVGMIQLWEQMWIYGMRRGFALLAYQRRLQIEQAKLGQREK